jgi:U32 family peptidase
MPEAPISPEAPELLAPAGNWDCLRAAVANGADAVYFGLPRFNARLRADNFSEDDLPRTIEFCHSHGIKAHVAFNTLIFTDELEDAAAQLRLLNRAGADAIIVQDLGLVCLAREIVPDLPIHASTQMTITSPEGAAMVRRELGVERIVLARELSLREIESFGTPGSGESKIPLEVFVHGALCVAYSGQCLTSEALGRRSANRGECAQACRMPYELIVDGALRDLGDRRYLLSPQDLAAVNEIPALIELGVVGFKIEGRLKSPEYVAAVTQVYRKAIDAALASVPPVSRRQDSAQTAVNDPITAADRYRLEMTFSRGFFTGWLHGVNHQQLVSARFGKKRGPFAGQIVRVGKDFVEIDAQVPLEPGDGVVFDTGGDTNHEQGGRIFEIKGRRLFFKHRHIDFSRLKPGDRVWKTDDPALNAELRKTFAGRIEPQRRELLHVRVSGKAGGPLVVEAWLVGAGQRGGAALPGSAGVSPAGEGVSPSRTSHDACDARDEVASDVASRAKSPSRRDARATRSGPPAIAIRSSIPLQAARTAPLTTERLRDHLGRFGESRYALGELENLLEGEVILPIGELNRLRRELVFKLDAQRKPLRRENVEPASRRLNEDAPGSQDANSSVASGRRDAGSALTVLCRTMDHIAAVLACGVRTIYADFEDIRRYKDAVALVRRSASDSPATQIFLATPRIQKAGEHGFFKLIENAGPDGVLIRNLGAIEYFAGAPPPHADPCGQADLRQTLARSATGLGSATGVGRFPARSAAAPPGDARRGGADRRNAGLTLIGDFSLNVANPLTAQFLMRRGLDRLTISYDLNIGQVLALLAGAPPAWFELTIHQHMPMFHMEHCVFAAFLSKGTSFLDCGRPCDRHRVHLRDRVGVEHPLRADVGCRNTLFNAVPQTGARFFSELHAAGLRHFRVELLEQAAGDSREIIRAYQALLSGERDGETIWRSLRTRSQLGVTKGTLGEK